MVDHTEIETERKAGLEEDVPISGMPSFQSLGDR